MNEVSKYIVLGNVDAGKSSFVSVMCNGKLDNGNGSARSLIVKTKHEIDTGRTSSSKPYYIVKDNEVVTLVDLCGHEKYLKTTLFGVTGMFADFGLLIVGVNQGISKNTIEHFGLLVSNKIPCIVVLNKMDLCPENVLGMVKKQLGKIARSNNKQLVTYETEQHNINCSHELIIEALSNGDNSTVPVICVSNKTGLNIDFCRDLLFAIRKQPSEELGPSYPATFYADHVFKVKGVGSVISGTVKYNDINVLSKLWLGPINGNYVLIVAKSLHDCVSQSIQTLKADKSGSIGLRLDKHEFDRNMFRKGMIITDCLTFAQANTFWAFTCEIVVFNHPTTITNGYQAVIHCGTIRQCGSFIIPDDVAMRCNSRQTITIRFMYRPEFILPGAYFMFRDGRTKGMGRIKSGFRNDC